ncbi:hypothetical protein CC86DRAFT_365714 [Ophiobolus disseminans]|uniref:F-box domain-containing protein n=1 Tax=Ophiobolus disseminans TaxID=1469910 RepID=A0A6A7ANN6_9PLEO|nr:hypothetical protein CC86DRAFT_365714 [Ophiobolus disseminans]
MVNAKGVAFKVNKQTPISQAPQQAYGTVINCRKPAGKRAPKERKEVRSHYVAFTNVEGTLKRKRGDEDTSPDGNSTFIVYQAQAQDAASASSSRTLPSASILMHRWQAPKPPRTRKLKLPSRGVDLDCWFTILSFSDPAQLLVMRDKIPSCYYFLRDNPMLWKHSRNYHHGTDLPEPPSELTEYQYANLRHDHGCQSCKSPNTRKTYWAFLRRWCKACLQVKTEKEHVTLGKLRTAHGEDSLMLQKCLSSGIFDSWGNFVGVGPATTHALKTVYLTAEVKDITQEYAELKAKHGNSPTWTAEVTAWFTPKVKLVEERKAFAHKMEAWEETLRNDRTYDYSARKAARKAFFQQKASELSPAISAREIECCASYKRAIAIPKDPNNTSWLQLKPKLEKEAAEIKAKAASSEESVHATSMSRTSTPPRIAEPQQPHRFPMGFPMRMGFQTQQPPPAQSHMHQGFQSQSHMHSALLPPPPLPPPPQQNHAHSSTHSHMMMTLPPPQHLRLPGLPPPHSHMF